MLGWFFAVVLLFFSFFWSGGQKFVNSPIPKGEVSFHFLVFSEGWLWRVGIASAVVKGIASLDWVAHTEVCFCVPVAFSAALCFSGTRIR